MVSLFSTQAIVSIQDLQQCITSNLEIHAIKMWQETLRSGTALEADSQHPLAVRQAQYAYLNGLVQLSRLQLSQATIINHNYIWEDMDDLPDIDGHSDVDEITSKSVHVVKHMCLLNDCWEILISRTDF
jgi:hypothetical protein